MSGPSEQARDSLKRDAWPAYRRLLSKVSCERQRWPSSVYLPTRATTEYELFCAGYNEEERRNIMSYGWQVPLIALKAPESVALALEELSAMAVKEYPSATLRRELRNLGNAIIEALHIPQLVDWLERKLGGRA